MSELSERLLDYEQHFFELNRLCADRGCMGCQMRSERAELINQARSELGWLEAEVARLTADLQTAADVVNPLRDEVFKRGELAAQLAAALMKFKEIPWVATERDGTRRLAEIRDTALAAAKAHGIEGTP